MVQLNTRRWGENYLINVAKMDDLWGPFRRGTQQSGNLVTLRMTIRILTDKTHGVLPMCWGPGGDGGSYASTLIISFGCRCHYGFSAEGRTEAQRGRATCHLLARSPASFLCRLGSEMLHEWPKLEEGFKPNSISGACVVSTRSTCPPWRASEVVRMEGYERPFPRAGR